MIDFHGWSMPISYGSQIEEHNAVRNKCGVFDVSHMTILEFTGDEVVEFLRYLLSNDIDTIIEDGDSLYSAMLNNKGGVIDDLVAYKMTSGYRLVVNCATKDSDLRWITSKAKNFKVNFIERPELAMLAVQGPKSFDLLKGFSESFSELTNKRRQQGILEGDILVSKTGYTGELGFEVILSQKEASLLWNYLISEGAKPIGLGARDTLRLEAGMNLYGYEMDENISPLEANMAWAVSLDDSKRRFIGKKSFIEKAKTQYSVLVGLMLDERTILRAGQKIYMDKDKRDRGIITSGTYSPTLKKPIALARIPNKDNLYFYAESRGKLLEGKVGTPNFVRQGKKVFKKNNE